MESGPEDSPRGWTSPNVVLFCMMPKCKLVFFDTVESGPEDSPRGWKSVDEPEFEYDDETGLDLEAHDGELKPERFLSVITSVNS